MIRRALAFLADAFFYAFIPIFLLTAAGGFLYWTYSATHRVEQKAHWNARPQDPEPTH